MNKIINGKIAAQKILDEISTKIKHLVAIKKRPPALAVVLVGDDQSSQLYVKNKQAACKNVGIKSISHLLSQTTTEKELLSLIKQLNADSEIDGILVQLPLPAHIDSKKVIDTISPSKDVDGFHRYNIGSLAINDPRICPCTPHGVMYLLDSLNLYYPGKHAVIVGTSNIVGRPMALELLNRGATVTICNSKTKDLATITSTADILISATGQNKLITADHVKENAIVIDVGITRGTNGKVHGDVDFDAVIDRVRYITPVPGGVGPMTIAILLQNTLVCYLREKTI